MSFLAQYWYLMIGVSLLVVYLIYNSRHRGLETPQTSDAREAGAHWSIWNLLGFGLIVVAFLYSTAMGYRILGLALVLGGIYAVTTRQVPYGIEGRAPAGYLRGAAAVIVGIVIAAVGMFFITAPHFVEEILRDSN